MRIINHSILGAGLSALIKDLNTKNAVIFSDNNKFTRKSERFYEFSGIGGNTNLWGGYIDIARFKSLLKNKFFSNFVKKTRIFRLQEFNNFKKNKTYYLCEYNNNNIFRVKKKYFTNKFINEKINKIKINKNFIEIFGKKKYKTKTLSLCIGNLGLIELLWNSKFIKDDDIISFQDGECSYSLKFFLNHKKYYYIPMKIGEIIQKLIFKKIVKYEKFLKDAFFFQKFSNNCKIYKFKTREIKKFKSKNLRFFLSNHQTNMKINSINIETFIKNLSKKINIYNSGAIQKYKAGPISQDIIYNAVIK